MQVNPRNTSKMCSGCGELVEKDLSVRIHNCSGCGLVLDRDHNAAINILALGLQSFVATDIEAASFRERSSHFIPCHVLLDGSDNSSCQGVLLPLK